MPGGPRVLAPSSWLCQPYRVSIPVLWRGIRKPCGLSVVVLESTLVSFCMRGDPFWTALGPGGPRVLALSSWLCQPYRVSISVMWCGICNPYGLSAAVLESTLVSFCVSGRSVFGLPSGRAGRACSRRAVGCVGPIAGCVVPFPLPLHVAYSGLSNRRMKCWVYLFFTSSIVGTGWSVSASSAAMEVTPLSVKPQGLI